MLRAVLFDLGDTLLNFGRLDHFAAFRKGAVLAHRYLLEKGEPVPDLDSYHKRQLRAIKRAYFWSHFTGKDCNALTVMADINRKMDLTTDPDLIRHLACLYYEPVRVQGRPEPKVHDVLRWLQDRSCKLAIISNTIVPGVTLDDHMEREGLRDYFPHRFYSCDVGCRKPQRRIFEMALDKIGVPAGEAMFIGDKLRIDVKGANRAGMVSVLKAPDGYSRLSLTRPDYVISALGELPDLIRRHDAS